MSSNPQGKMSDFMREVANWTWDEFWKAERDKTYTSNQAVIFALIRACAGEDLKAIRLSINRMDGKLKTPIVIETPKIYTVYPFADAIEGPNPAHEIAIGVDEGKPGGDMTAVVTMEGDTVVDIKTFEPPEAEVVDEELDRMTMRETLNKMSDYPRDTPPFIIDLAEKTEAWMRKQGPEPEDTPRVKSVVAAHLLMMSQRRNIDAMTEVFDQIDGKLAETIELIGEDIYITSYSGTAPAGAVKNADGYYQIEASQAQMFWAEKLAGKALS